MFEGIKMNINQEMRPKVFFTTYNDLLGKSSGQKKKCVPVFKLMIKHSSLQHFIFVFQQCNVNRHLFVFVSKSRK